MIFHRATAFAQVWKIIPRCGPTSWLPGPKAFTAVPPTSWPATRTSAQGQRMRRWCAQLIQDPGGLRGCRPLVCQITCCHTLKQGNGYSKPGMLIIEALNSTAVESLRSSEDDLECSNTKILSSAEKNWVEGNKGSRLHLWLGHHPLKRATENPLDLLYFFPKRLRPKFSWCFAWSWANHSHFYQFFRVIPALKKGKCLPQGAIISSVSFCICHS